MLRRDRMLVLSAMLIGVAWCGLAPAQDSTPSGGADREIQIRDRYEQVLATDPMRDPAFDRTYDAYLALEGIDAWVEKLQAPAATEQEVRARLVLLGRIASRRFRSRDAVTHLEQAREQGMTGPRFQVLLGKEYARVGRDDEAIAELTAAVEALTDPAERADVCRALGSLLLRRGREAEAIATWERIAEGEGADALALAELAEIYEDNRKWEEAIGAYRRMLDASAGDPYRACRALRAIGRCQEQLEQMPEAVATYEQALSLAAPGNWMYEDLKRRLVAAYDRMGDLDGLSRYLEARIASAPADLDARELLADTYRRLGRIEEAEAAYREALARDPKRIATYERLIALYASQGRTGDEAAAYEELIAAYPSDLDYVRRLGEAHLRAGDAVSAKAAWERITLPQATPERLALLATWLERYEFPDEAIAAYEQALQMRSDREWVLRLAGLKHQRGVTEEARVLWLSAAGAEATAEEVAEIAAILSGHDLTADATALWRRAAALAPTSDAYRLSLARSLAEDEAYEEATALFEALAREAQTDLHRGQAEQGLIDAYAEMGVLEAKQAEWEAAAAASPEDVDLQMRLARLYDRGGDVYRGLAVVEACAAIRPDDPALLRELARRYRRARRIDQSIAAYTRLIETDRTRALAYLKELLQVYRDAGDSRGAVATAQRLVEQNPTNPEARALLAQTYEQARDQEAAVVEYRAAVRLDPTEPAYLRGYAQALLSAGQWGEAGDAARRMLEAATAREMRLEAISILTQVHQRQGALDALLRELEERVRTTPADFAAYEELGAAYRYAGQPARALEVMSGALDQVDNRQEALRTLIRESFDALAFDKVLGFYEELLAIAGSLTPEEYERIGRVYAQLGHPDRALEIWNRIVEEDPGNPRAYERLARILASEGRLEASLTARERALDLDPYNHAMRYELAMSLAGLDQTDRAMAQVEMILELGPSPEELAAEEAGAAPPVSGMPPTMLFPPGSRPHFSVVSAPPAGASYADYRSAAIGLLLNLAESAGSAEDVIARFREKAEQEPDNIQAQLDLMHVCGRPEEALDIGLALLERVPDDLSLARRVMEQLFDQQRTDEALALAEKLAERFPEQRRDLRLSLYHRLGRINRPEEARALLEELVAEYPDDRSLAQIVIHARAAEGDADGAMALAESFMTAHPDEAETIRRIAAQALRDVAPERALDLYEAALFDVELPAIGQFQGRAPSQGIYVVTRLGDADRRRSVSNLLMSMPSVAEAVRISSPQASACEALTGPDAPPERRAAALARMEAEAAKLAEAKTTEAYDRALAFCALRALVHIGDGEIAEARRWLAPFLSDARPTLAAANLELYLLDLEGRYAEMAQRYAALRREFPGLAQSLLQAEASAWRLAQNGEAAADAIIASLAGISAPGVFVEQIRTLTQLGRGSDARRLLEGFLSESNRNPDALVVLAGLYHKEGDTRRALELVKEAYFAQAQRDLMSGQFGSFHRTRGMGMSAYGGMGSVVWPTGLSSGTSLPGFHPGPVGRGATRQPSELLRLWHTYAKELNETAEMVAEFEERLRQQSNAIQAHVELAQVYRLEERYEDVIAVYRRLIERQPTYHAARHALATLLVERNRITEAIEVYEQLMQVHPAGRRMYRSPLRELYRRIGEKARVEELDRDAMQRATTPREALTLAQEFRATGDLAQAEELYRRALRMDPTQGHLHRELAQILRQEGKLEEALEVNRTYLAIASGGAGSGFDPGAVGEAVSLSRELGRLAELTEEQGAALAADPKNAQAKYFLACIAQDEGDFARALSLLRELDTDGRFVNDVVNVLEMSGDTAGLYAYLKEQAEAPGQRYADYRRLARCAMALGDREAALHWVEENARQQQSGRFANVLDELISLNLWEEAEAYYLAHRREAARDMDELGRFDRSAVQAWANQSRFDAALRTVLSSGEHGPVDQLIERLSSWGGGNTAQRAAMLTFLQERYADRPDVLKGMFQLANNTGDDPAAIALVRRLLELEPNNEAYIEQYTSLLGRYGGERELIAWYEARAEADWTVGTVAQLARHLKEKGYVKRYEALKARAIETAPAEERERFVQAFADVEAPPAQPRVAPYQIMPGMPVMLPPEALAQLPPGTTGSPLDMMKAAIRANPSAAMLEQFMMQLASFQQDGAAYELFREFRDEPFMADWRLTGDQWLQVLLRFGDEADRRRVYEHVYTTAMAPQRDPGFAMGAPPGVARLYLIPQYLPPNHHAGFAAFLDAKLAELEGPSREQCMLFAQLYGAVQAHDRVLELTDRVIADGWRHADVIRMRASALGSLGRYDEQIAALEGLRARASAEEKGRLALEVARAMIAAGRPDQADEVVAGAVAEDRSPNLALMAGQYYLDERENPEAALPLLEKTYADPERAENAAEPLARCYALQGRAVEAVGVVERYPSRFSYPVRDLAAVLLERGAIDAATRMMLLVTDGNRFQDEAFRAVFSALLERDAFEQAMQFGEQIAAQVRSGHQRGQVSDNAARALLATGRVGTWLAHLAEPPSAFAVHAAARLAADRRVGAEEVAAMADLLRAHVDLLAEEQETATYAAGRLRDADPELALAIVRALLGQEHLSQSAASQIWDVVVNIPSAEAVELALTALDRTPSRVATSWDTVRFVAEHGTDEQVARLREVYAEFYPHAGQLSLSDGHVQFLRGDYEAGLDAIEVGCADPDVTASELLTAAELLEAEQRLDAADAAYARVRTANPVTNIYGLSSDVHIARLARLRLAWRRGDADGVRALFAEAAAEAPGGEVDDATVMTTAQALANLGLRDEALRLVDERFTGRAGAMALMQTQGLGFLGHLGGQALAEQMLRRVLENAPDSQYLLGSPYVFPGMGSSEFALEVYRRMGAALPAHMAHLLQMLGHQFIEAGLPDEVIALQKEQLRVADPMRGGPGPSLQERVAAHAAAGRIDALLAETEAKLRARPGDLDAQLTRAYALIQKRRIAEGVDRALTAMENGAPPTIAREVAAAALHLEDPGAVADRLEAQVAAAGTTQYVDTDALARLRLAAGDVDRAVSLTMSAAPEAKWSGSARQGFERLAALDRWEEAAAWYATARRAMAETGSDACELDRLMLRAIEDGHLGPETFRAVLAEEATATTTGASLRAVKQHYQGDLEGAMGWIRPLLEAHPDAPGLHRIAAELHRDNGDPQSAVAHYERTITLDSAKPEEVRAFADLLFAAGMEERALTVLRNRLGETPTREDVEYFAAQLARAHRAGELLALVDRDWGHLRPSQRQGLRLMLLEAARPLTGPDLASAGFQEARAAGGDEHLAMRYLSHLSDTGRLDEAWQELEGGSCQLSLRVMMPGPAARVYLRHGRTEEAADIVLAAMFNSMSYPVQAGWFGPHFGASGFPAPFVAPMPYAVQGIPAGPGIGYPLTMPDIPGVLEPFGVWSRRLAQRVAEETPGVADRFQRRVHLAQLAGDATMRLRAADEALAERPKWPAALETRAMALGELGRHVEAAETWRRLTGMRPLAMEGVREVAVARALFAAGRPEEARAELAAVRAWSHDASTRAQMGDLLLEYGAAAEAEAEYRLALRRDPTQVGAAAGLAVLCLSDGRTEEGMAFWRRLPHDGAPSRRSVAARLREQGHADAALPLFAALLAQRPGAPQGLTALLSTADAMGDGAWERVLDAMATAVGRTRGERRDDLQRTFGAWCARAGRIDALIAAVSAEGGAHAGLAASVAEAVRAVAEEDASNEGPSAERLDAAEALAIDTPAGQLALGDAATRIGDTDRAARRLQQAAAHGDATIGQRRAAAAGLLAAGRAREALEVFDALLDDQPNLYMRDADALRAAALTEDAEALAGRLDACRPYLANDAQARWLRAHADWLGDRREAALAAWDPLVGDRDLTGDQLCAMADCFDEAGRPERALQVHAQLAAGGYGNARAAVSLARLIAAAAEAGDLQQAVTLYARLAPLNARRAADVAGAIADATTAERLPELRAALATVIQTDPANNRVSECAALYAHAARGHGEAVTAAAFATELGGSAIEIEEAAYWDGAFRDWRVASTADAFDENALDALRELLASDAAYVPDADEAITLTPLPEAMTAGAPTGSAFVASTTVHVDAAGRRTLQVLAPGPVAVRVNGRPVQVPARVFGAGFDAFLVEVDVVAGENALLLMVQPVQAIPYFAAGFGSESL